MGPTSLPGSGAENWPAAPDTGLPGTQRLLAGLPAVIPLVSLAAESADPRSGPRSSARRGSPGVMGASAGRQPDGTLSGLPTSDPAVFRAGWRQYRQYRFGGRIGQRSGGHLLYRIQARGGGTDV